MSRGPGFSGRYMPSGNEVEVEMPVVTARVRRVVLRRFLFSLTPIGGAGGTDGLELELVAADTGLTVSVRFERSEFVNIATAGLQMLDEADGAEPTEGRET